MALRGRPWAWARAPALLVLAGAPALLAWVLARGGGAFSGDPAWSLFWLAAAAVWLAAAREAVRAPRAPRPRG